MLNESEADWYHLDIMDGRFVPNISFGPMLVEFFRKATKKVCDVHLMIEEPGNFAEQFKNAGADNLVCSYRSLPAPSPKYPADKILGNESRRCDQSAYSCLALVKYWLISIWYA